MNQEKYLYRISQLLSRFREQVNILTSNSEFSINIHAENILIKILNLLYECDLENVNYVEGKTYPSIDLRDKSNKVAFQITSTANLEKIKHTIEKFIENDLYKTFPKLYVFIITDKQKTYDQDKIDIETKGLFKFSKNQILDRSDLYKLLNEKNDLDLIKQIHQLLEKQFADEKTFNKWDIYCNGIEEYDRYIIEKFNYIDIKGFSPRIDNRQIKISLEKIFVPLFLTTEIERQIENNEIKTKNEKRKIFQLNALIAEQNRITVLGDPGSGKTTLLKYLAFTICKERELNTEYSDLIPIFIRSADYAKFYDTFQKPLAEYIINHYEKKFERIFLDGLQQNNIIVFFDGLDEINNVQLRHDIVNQVNDFIALYPKNKIIATSRKVGYQETRLSSHFVHFEVMDFDIPQIKSFTKNWYLSIAEGSDKDIKQANEKADNLIKSISRNQSVKRLAKNPLLITIISLIDYQGTTLPEKRVELYDIATSTFLENWVNQRRSARKITFDKKGLIEILSPIAFYMHENFSDGLISEEMFKLLLTKSYSEIYPYSDKRNIQKEVKEIIDFVREDAGFIFEKGRDKNGNPLFGFVHLTFQEYFASIEFSTKWKEGYLSAKLEDFIFNPTWHEVVLLTSSQFRLSDPTRIGRQKTTEFVQNIFDVNDNFPEIYRPIKLILRILIDEVEIHSDFFEKTINYVFKEILSVEDDHFGNYKSSQISTFEYLIGQLLKTRTYGKFLLNRIIDELKVANETPITHNLTFILMHASEIEDVKCEILNILNNNNNFELKNHIFNYNVVYPVCEITKSIEFKKSMVEFVNSEMFVKDYKRLPTQYTKCFVYDEWSLFDDNRTEKTKKSKAGDVINSIRAIKNKNIQQDLANDVLTSVSWYGIENLIEYRDLLIKEFPDISTTKINEFINKEKEKEKQDLGLDNNLLANFNGTLILSNPETKTKLEFFKNGVSVVVSYPVLDENDELNSLLGDDKKDIINFLNFIFPLVNNETESITFKDMEEFKLFSKYQRNLHWRVNFKEQKEPVVNMILNLASDDMQFQNHFKKLMSLSRDIYQERIKLKSEVKNDVFIQKIKQNNLEIYQKLLVISLIGQKNDYVEYIIPTIELFRNTEEKELKNILFDILSRVLTN